MAVPTDADRKRRVLIANFHERNRGRKKKVFDFGSSANQTTVLGSLIVAQLGRTNARSSRLAAQCDRSPVLVIAAALKSGSINRLKFSQRRDRARDSRRRRRGGCGNARRSPGRSPLRTRWG